MNPHSRTRVAALIIGVTAGILALTVALVALRAEPEGQGRTTSTPSVTVSPSPSASPTHQPLSLDPLILTASLDEPPVRWTELAFIPAGEGEHEIGYSPCSDCVLPVPSSLAVDGDGSFWIADGLKARIAHFTRDGSFIEAFPAKSARRLGTRKPRPTSPSSAIVSTSYWRKGSPGSPPWSPAGSASRLP